MIHEDLSLRSPSLNPRYPQEVLSDLLNKEPYRDMWGQFVQRRRNSGISIRAVATYMACELSDAMGEEMAPEQFKDSVRRALNGSSITDQTINRFISAFGFSEREAQELWRSTVYHRYLLDPNAGNLRNGGDSEPQRYYRSMAQTSVFTIDQAGMGQTYDYTEIFVSQTNNLRYFNPVFEGHNLYFEIIDGGQLISVECGKKHKLGLDFPLTYHLKIKTPYPLREGEIHRVRIMVYVHETPNRFDQYNVFFSGSSQTPRFNITNILSFETAPQEIKHCIWDINEYKHPVIEELLPPGLQHYSMHYPVIHKAKYEFSWLIPKNNEISALSKNN